MQEVLAKQVEAAEAKEKAEREAKREEAQKAAERRIRNLKKMMQF